MESPRGRPGPDADLVALPVPQPQAARCRGGPGRPSSEPPSGLLRVSGEEEAEDRAGASRSLRASSSHTCSGGVQRPPREEEEDEPGARATPAGPEGRRGAPADPDPPVSSRRRDPEPPPEDARCRRGGAGGGMEGEQAALEEDDGDEEAAAGRLGRSSSSRLQDSRSLDGLSGACGGAEGGAGSGGRRATISSPLELEGTVSRHGDLTHFVANNLQLKIRLSGAPPPPPAAAPARSCPAAAPPPAIPPIDPDVLRDLERLSRELGGRVDRLLRGLGGAVQELTALSVGCIQTYRDAVDSLGEAVDMSIKGMYTLLARCEELERALQPVQGLARQVRDIRRTLEVLEALCK
ncbi:BLOC-1-related complex subunit 6 [Ochotona curzoniae]|uniref:BLOC-1-related complex subunit 6 n=1 Tax=Ochotona curzoniae TaxID=130825 RepID=UPI001B34E269|nr:BLOC-1-related complex subunit 6 [Ochotona curzoniae]